MEDWETPYMENLAEAISHRGGHTLEIGYGMGISTSAILACEQVESHTVIECHPDVVKKALEDQREAINANRLRMLSGFWQDLTPTLAADTYDGILFDSYLFKPEEVHVNHFSFFETAKRLLKPMGFFVYFSDEEVGLSPEHLRQLAHAGFQPEDIDYGICEVVPPEDCNYWKSQSLLVPIIRKPLIPHRTPFNPSHRTLMRVAIDDTHEMTELSPNDEELLTRIGNLQLRTQVEEMLQSYEHVADDIPTNAQDVILIIRHKEHHAATLGIIAFRPISDEVGRAFLRFCLFDLSQSEVLFTAIACALKYVARHFGIHSLVSDTENSGLNGIETLQAFGFAYNRKETGYELDVDAETLKYRLAELKLPKAYQVKARPQMENENRHFMMRAREDEHRKIY